MSVIEAKTWYVGAGDTDCKTINEAVAAAADGDVIIVKASEYTMTDEIVNVNKALTIKAEGDVTVDRFAVGSGASKPQDIVIEGFTFKPTANGSRTCGIYQSSTNLTSLVVKDCTFDLTAPAKGTTGYGIHLDLNFSGTEKVTVDGCTFTGDGNLVTSAMRASYQSSIEFTNNTVTNISGHAVQLSLTGPVWESYPTDAKVSFEGNTFTDIGACAIYAADIKNNNVTFNVTGNEFNGINLEGGSAYWGAIRFGSGSCNGVTIKDNTIVDGNVGIYQGVALKDGATGSVEISGNNFFLSDRADYSDSSVSRPASALNVYNSATGEVLAGDFADNEFVFVESADHIFVDAAFAGKDGELVTVNGKNYIVGKNAFASVKDAVDAARDTAVIEVAAGTYTEDITFRATSIEGEVVVGNPARSVTIKAAEGVAKEDVILAGTYTLGYRNQGVGAEQWKGSINFEGVTLDHAESSKHSLDIQDVLSFRVTDCNIIGDGEYGVCSSRGNATTDGVFSNCYFENAGMQILGQLGVCGVIENSTFKDSHVNVQGGGGFTITGCEFNNTLTDANDGDSFYVVRSNALVVNIDKCTFNVDSTAGDIVPEDGKVFAVLWQRNASDKCWNVSGVTVNFSDAAMAKENLYLSYSADDSTGCRIVFTDLASADDGIAALLAKTSGEVRAFDNDSCMIYNDGVLVKDITLETIYAGNGVTNVEAGKIAGFNAFNGFADALKAATAATSKIEVAGNITESATSEKIKVAVDGELTVSGGNVTWNAGSNWVWFTKAEDAESAKVIFDNFSIDGTGSTKTVYFGTDTVFSGNSSVELYNAAIQATAKVEVNAGSEFNVFREELVVQAEGENKGALIVTGNEDFIATEATLADRQVFIQYTRNVYGDIQLENTYLAAYQDIVLKEKAVFTADNSFVVLGADKEGNYHYNPIPNGYGNLKINGADAVFTLANGSVLNASGNIVNSGTLNIENSSFVADGTLVSNGVIAAAYNKGTVTNAGTINISNSGSMEVANTITSSGTIYVDTDSTLKAADIAFGENGKIVIKIDGELDFGQSSKVIIDVAEGGITAEEKANITTDTVGYTVEFEGEDIVIKNSRTLVVSAEELTAAFADEKTVAVYVDGKFAVDETLAEQIIANWDRIVFASSAILLWPTAAFAEDTAEAITASANIQLAPSKVLGGDELANAGAEIVLGGEAGFNGITDNINGENIDGDTLTITNNTESDIRSNINMGDNKGIIIDNKSELKLTGLVQTSGNVEIINNSGAAGDDEAVLNGGSDEYGAQINADGKIEVNNEGHLVGDFSSKKAIFITNNSSDTVIGNYSAPDVVIIADEGKAGSIENSTLTADNNLIIRGQTLENNALTAETAYFYGEDTFAGENTVNVATNMRIGKASEVVVDDETYNFSGDAAVTVAAGAKVTLKSAATESGLHISGAEKSDDKHSNGTLNVYGEFDLSENSAVVNGALNIGKAEGAEAAGSFTALKMTVDTAAPEDLVKNAKVTVSDGAVLKIAGEAEGENNYGMFINEQGELEINGGIVDATKIDNTGAVTVAGGVLDVDALTNSGTLKVTGEKASKVKAAITGNAVQLENGVLEDSEIDGTVNVYGTDNTINGGTYTASTFNVGWNGYSASAVKLNMVGNINLVNKGDAKPAIWVGNADGTVLAHTLAIGDKDAASKTTKITGDTQFYVRSGAVVTVDNADFAYQYMQLKGSMTVNNSTISSNWVNHFMYDNDGGVAKLTLTNSQWNVLTSGASEINIGNTNVGDRNAKGSAEVYLYSNSSISGKTFELMNANGNKISLTSNASSINMTDEFYLGTDATASFKVGSKLEAKTLTVNGALTMDATSLIAVDAIAGEGTISVDATGFDGVNKVVDIIGDGAAAQVELIGDNAAAYLVENGNDTYVSTASRAKYLLTEAANGEFGAKVAEGYFTDVNAFDTAAEAVAALTADTNEIILTANNETSYGRLSVQKDVILSTVGEGVAKLGTFDDDANENPVANTVTIAEGAKIEVVDYTVLRPDDTLLVNGELTFAKGVTVYGKSTVEVASTGVLTFNTGRMQNTVNPMTVYGKFVLNYNADDNFFPKVAGNENGTNGTLIVDGSKGAGVAILNTPVLTIGGGFDSNHEPKDMERYGVLEVKNGGKVATNAISFWNGVNSKISVDGAGSSFTIGEIEGGTDWDPATVAGWNATIESTYKNDGEITVSNGAAIDLGTKAFTNNGTIEVTDAAFTASNVTDNNKFTVSGNSTFDVDTVSGEIELASGEITLQAAGGDYALVDGSTITLEGELRAGEGMIYNDTNKYGSAYDDVEAAQGTTLNIAGDIQAQALYVSMNSSVNVKEGGKLQAADLAGNEGNLNVYGGTFTVEKGGSAITAVNNVTGDSVIYGDLSAGLIAIAQGGEGQKSGNMLVDGGKVDLFEGSVIVGATGYGDKYFSAAEEDADKVATLTITNGAVVNLNDNDKVGSGMTVNAGALVDVNGGSTLNIGENSDEAVLVNDGTVKVNGAEISADIITNKGTFDVNGEVTAGSFANSGILNIIGNDAVITSAITGDGAVVVKDGADYATTDDITANRIYVGYDLATNEDTAASKLTVADDDVVSATGEGMYVRSGSSVVVDGTLNAALINLKGDLTVNGSVVVDGTYGGSVDAGAVITVNGSFSNAARYNESAGDYVVGENGSIVIAGGKFDWSAVGTNGAANVVNNGSITVSGDSQINATFTGNAVQIAKNAVLTNSAISAELALNGAITVNASYISGTVTGNQVITVTGDTVLALDENSAVKSITIDGKAGFLSDETTIGSIAINGKTGSELTADADVFAGNKVSKVALYLTDVDYADVIALDIDSIANVKAINTFAVTGNATAGYRFKTDGGLVYSVTEADNGLNFAQIETDIAGNVTLDDYTGSLDGLTADTIIEGKAGTAKLKISNGKEVEIAAITKDADGGVNNITIGKEAVVAVSGNVEEIGKLSTSTGTELTINGAAEGTNLNSTISLGKDNVAEFNGGIDLEGGKNTFSIGARTDATVTGDVANVRTIKVASGTYKKATKTAAASTDLTTMTIYGDIVAPAMSNSITLGNYAKLSVYGGLNNSDVNVGTKIKVGKNSNINFSGAMLSVSGLTLGSGSTFDQKGGSIIGTYKNNTFSFGADSVVNVQNIDLVAGKNTVKVGNGADITAGTVANISKLTIGKTADVKIAAVEGVNASVSLSTGAELKVAGQMTGLSKLTIGKEAGVTATAVEGVNANISLAAEAELTVAGNVTGVNKLTVAKGAELDIDGILSGTDKNDTISFANNAEITEFAEIDSIDLGLGNDKLAIGNNVRFKTADLAFGDGNDTLTLGKNAIIKADDISGVETLKASKGAVIIASSINDVNGDIKLDDVAGTWKNATIYDLEGVLNAGTTVCDGQVYGNEWDVYEFTVADQSTDQLILSGFEPNGHVQLELRKRTADGFDPVVVTDWTKEISLENGEYSLCVSVDNADFKGEKETYKFNATLA